MCMDEIPNFILVGQPYDPRATGGGDPDVFDLDHLFPRPEPIMLRPEGSLAIDDAMQGLMRGFIFETGLWKYLDVVDAWANCCGHLQIGVREGQTTGVYEGVTLFRVLDRTLTFGQLEGFRREWQRHYGAKKTLMEYHPVSGMVTFYDIQVG